MTTTNNLEFNCSFCGRLIKRSKRIMKDFYKIFDIDPITVLYTCSICKKEKKTLDK